MAIAVMTPVLIRSELPEFPGSLVTNGFNAIEDLDKATSGRRPRVLFAYDYDPGSAPELDPMARAMTWHAFRKGYQCYFMALWPVGPQKTREALGYILPDFPKAQYGEDYVELGFKAGNEGVIKNVATNLRELFPTDKAGKALSDIPMTRDIYSVGDFDLVVNISAGYPGTKEWVLYATTPKNVKLVAGCTGVQAPLLYPYYPAQMVGLLGAIKGAAEYEKLLGDRYPEFRTGADDKPREAFREGRKRMGPQLVAHVTILAMIILGNVIMFMERRAGRRAA
ncbi:MAG: hypothetical protein KDA32_08395 [Phycisphaerales bacterium]|nr:hypothetical protein [Phycisphaerales bacterium]